MDFPQGMDFEAEALPRTGMIISGAFHLGIIALVLLSPFFRSRDSAHPVSTTEVSLISPEEFAALAVPENSVPEVPQAEIALPAPAPEEEATPAMSADPLPAPETPPAAPLTPSEPVTEETPDVPPPPAPPVAEVEDQSPAQSAPEAFAPDAPPSDTPTPREAPRVAPEPSAPPPPEARPDEVLREEVSQSPDAAAKQPEVEATAPPEASTEIVTEAEEPASGAPLSSPRPRARPARPAPPVAVVKSPSAEEPAPKEAADDAMAAAIAAAVEDAASTPAPAASPPAVPAGPPLSRGEKEGFRLAVSRCWNVGALSAEALRVTVTVGFSLTRDGRPEPASLHMISATGGSDGAARQAYEAARRAILRCGARGYNLPIEKYEHWRDIEITFNPEKMRIK